MSKSKSRTLILDNITIYLGLTLIVLSIFHIIIDIPKQYFISFTISGALFAVSDFILVTPRKNNDEKIREILMFLGIFSAVALPIILSSFEYLLNSMKYWSDFATLFALGVIIISVGARSRNNLNNVIFNKFKELESLEAKLKNYDEQQENFRRKRKELFEKKTVSNIDQENNKTNNSN